MTIRFQTNVQSQNFDPREFLQRSLSRAMPAVRFAFLNHADGTLRDTVSWTADRKSGVVVATVPQKDDN